MLSNVNSIQSNNSPAFKGAISVVTSGKKITEPVLDKFVNKAKLMANFRPDGTPIGRPKPGQLEITARVGEAIIPIVRTAKYGTAKLVKSLDQVLKRISGRKVSLEVRTGPDTGVASVLKPKVTGASDGDIIGALKKIENNGAGLV